MLQKNWVLILNIKTVFEWHFLAVWWRKHGCQKLLPDLCILTITQNPEKRTPSADEALLFKAEGFASKSSSSLLTWVGTSHFSPISKDGALHRWWPIAWFHGGEAGQGIFNRMQGQWLWSFVNDFQWGFGCGLPETSFQRCQECGPRWLQETAVPSGTRLEMGVSWICLLGLTMASHKKEIVPHWRRWKVEKVVRWQPWANRWRLPLPLILTGSWSAWLITVNQVEKGGGVGSVVGK